MYFPSISLVQVSSEASEEEEEGGGGGGTGVEGDNQAGVVEKESEGDWSYKHRLSNVNFINMGRLQKIKCVVDNQASVVWCLTRVRLASSSSLLTSHTTVIRGGPTIVFFCPARCLA